MEEKKMGLIGGLIIGAIAGFIGSYIMGEKSGLIKNLLLGIGGGFVGGLIFKLIGLPPSNIIGSLIVSVVGACLCIFAGRKLFK